MTPPARKNQLDDFRALCSCLSLAQTENYETWIKIGTILKSIGAPVSLYEEVSKGQPKLALEQAGVFRRRGVPRD